MKNKNQIVDKSKKFALRIIKMYKFLTEEKKEYILSKQLMRSGTSIGANVREAQRAQSDRDFVSKMQIAQKQADETAYWLELLFGGEYLTQIQFDSIYRDCGELLRLLSSIIISKKDSISNSSFIIHNS